MSISFPILGKILAIITGNRLLMSFVLSCFSFIPNPPSGTSPKGPPVIDNIGWAPTGFQATFCVCTATWRSLCKILAHDFEYRQPLATQGGWSGSNQAWRDLWKKVIWWLIMLNGSLPGTKWCGKAAQLDADGCKVYSSGHEVQVLLCTWACWVGAK